METNEINDVFQSAYRPHHSTETVVVKIFSDICISIGRKREVILYLLDISSAFDTLKHTILLQRLHDIGINGSGILQDLLVMDTFITVDMYIFIVMAFL